MGALGTKFVIIAVLAVVAGGGVGLYLSDQGGQQQSASGFGQPGAPANATSRPQTGERPGMGQGGPPSAATGSARPGQPTGATGRSPNAAGRPGGPPRGFGMTTPVIIEPVVMGEFVDSIEAIGTAKSNESVVVTAKVTETVSTVNFFDGQSVEAGKILVELTDVEASADLAEARASLREAEKGFERISGLVSRGNATRSSLDTAVAALDRAKANVSALEARMADRLIRAPFAGILGLRSVSPGMLVRPGDTIATLDDISIVKLDFSIPETYLGSLGLGLEVTARSAAYPDREFAGTITAIDTRVDPETRAITVRAEIPNQELLLKPGMLLTTEVINDRRASMTVPEEAVVPVKDDLFVYVVRETERGTIAEQRRIEIGSRRPGAVEVVRGLEIGEQVVTEGTHRVTPGKAVKVVSSPAGRDGA